MMADPKELIAAADQLDAQANELESRAKHERHKGHLAGHIVSELLLDMPMAVDLDNDADDLEREAATLRDQAADKRREAQDESARLEAAANDKYREAAHPDLENDPGRATELEQEADELRRRAAGL